MAGRSMSVGPSPVKPTTAGFQYLPVHCRHRHRRISIAAIGAYCSMHRGCNSKRLVLTAVSAGCGLTVVLSLLRKINVIIER